MIAHLRRRWLPFALAALLAVAGATLIASPASAQTDDAVTSADEPFDENETEGTIDRVRLQLLGIAAVTGVLLIGYVWHTDPQRRLRVATRRRDERERDAIVALDETFVLPADIGDDPVGDDDDAVSGDDDVGGGDVEAGGADPADGH